MWLSVWYVTCQKLTSKQQKLGYRTVLSIKFPANKLGRVEKLRRASGVQLTRPVHQD